jgi:hypothetical protein
VKLPSLVNGLARPKSASFKSLPPLNRRLDPINSYAVRNHKVRIQMMNKKEKVEVQSR